MTSNKIQKYSTKELKEKCTQIENEIEELHRRLRNMEKEIFFRERGNVF